MIAVGIWLGTLGYAVFYYGVKLWIAEPVAIADALGFGSKKAAK